MTHASLGQAELLAAPGSAGLEARLVAGQSALTNAWCRDPIKLLVPRPRGPSVWAYLSSFGGGLVAGDQTSVTLRLGAGARCFLTTQASTKIYRNPARLPCSHRVFARLDAGSVLILAPDPVQCFAESSYLQRQQFHLQSGAGLVLLDWYSSGRMARGERWSFRRFSSRNEIFIDGKLRLLDSVLLESAQSPIAGEHRLGRFNCVAMMAILGQPLCQQAASIRAVLAQWSATKRAPVVMAASPLDDGVLIRLAGEQFEDVARVVYETLGFAGALLSDDPWTRKMQSAAIYN